MTKKIIITGATGFIGRKLCEKLISRGDEVSIFTRDPLKAKLELPDAKEYIKWNYNEIDSWQNHIEGKNSIIHLAGANISGKRWTKKYKELIINSRVISTKNLIKAIENSRQKPESFIISSAVGYYGNCGDKILTETSESGDGFLAEVCEKWEEESKAIDSFGVRRVNVRTGIALSPKAGALKKMLLPFKLFVGGPLGNGKQWFPWIHIDDLIDIYIFALDNDLNKGPLNAVSPVIVTMKEFAKELGNKLNRPSIFPFPKLMLELLVGEVTESILASQKAVPQKLLENKFQFRFENIKDALADLL